MSPSPLQGRQGADYSTDWKAEAQRGRTFLRVPGRGYGRGVSWTQDCGPSVQNLSSALLCTEKQSSQTGKNPRMPNSAAVGTFLFVGM